MVEVARRSPVPIATGESLSNKQQFAELLKHDVVNIIQPEPLNLGGLFTARIVAGMADAHFARNRAAQRARPGVFGGMRTAQRFHP